MLQEVAFAARRHSEAGLRLRSATLRVRRLSIGGSSGDDDTGGAGEGEPEVAATAAAAPRRPAARPRGSTKRQGSRSSRFLSLRRSSFSVAPPPAARPAAADMGGRERSASAGLDLHFEDSEYGLGNIPPRLPDAAKVAGLAAQLDELRGLLARERAMHGGGGGAGGPPADRGGDSPAAAAIRAAFARVRADLRSLDPDRHVPEDDDDDDDTVAEEQQQQQQQQQEEPDASPGAASAAATADVADAEPAAEAVSPRRPPPGKKAKRRARSSVARRAATLRPGRRSSKPPADGNTSG